MEKNALGALIQENQRQLYRIAKSILREDEDCNDAVQEAILKAFENLHTLRNDQYAKTWLIRILIHECYRLASRRQREQAAVEKWKNQIPQKETEKDYSSLYEALMKLEQEFRIVLELYYMEGFSVKEIAGLLEIPEGTVKSRLGRGREKLRKCLSQEREGR